MYIIAFCFLNQTGDCKTVARSFYQLAGETHVSTYGSGKFIASSRINGTYLTQDEEGRSLLHWAVDGNHMPLIKALLEVGVDTTRKVMIILVIGLFCFKVVVMMDSHHHHHHHSSTSSIDHSDFFPSKTG